MSASLARRVAPANPVTLLAELLPSLAVAAVLLPFIIEGGSAWPWSPNTIDLDVYRLAAQDYLAGRDFYDTVTPHWLLKFIYPPIALLLLLPTAFGPRLLWQLVWAVALVAAQQDVLRRLGVRRGWVLGLIGAVAIFAVEPLRTTLGYGQVNTLLMWLVVADLLPGRRRWLPRGVGIGLAAAIKLTPALFVVFLFAIGRHRIAAVATGTFTALTLVGAVIAPAATWRFFSGLAQGQTGTASPVYVGNQSILGVVTRWTGEGRTATLMGLGIGAILALLAVAVAAAAWRRSPALAIALVGLGTCLASPLSWTHHWVWVLPLLAVVLRRQLRGWPDAWALMLVCWVSACLPLAVLQYGGGVETTYPWYAMAVAQAGPILAAAGVVGLAFGYVRARP